MWSLSSHLRANHMGNSMKIRMRFIQNMQWRQQKGREKNDALYDYDSILVSVLVSPMVSRRYEKAIWVASPAAQLLSAGSGCHNGL